MIAAVVVLTVALVASLAERHLSEIRHVAERRQLTEHLIQVSVSKNANEYAYVEKAGRTEPPNGTAPPRVPEFMVGE